MLVEVILIQSFAQDARGLVSSGVAIHSFLLEHSVHTGRKHPAWSNLENLQLIDLLKQDCNLQAEENVSVKSF